MKKKVLIVIVVIIGLLSYLVVTNISLKAKASPVEEIVNKAIKIQYRGGDKKELSEVFTPKFIKQINSMPYFYKKRIFYVVEKDYMKSFQILSKKEAFVSVRVEDLSRSYIQEITLVKGSDGHYLVSNIQFDI